MLRERDRASVNTEVCPLFMSDGSHSVLKLLTSHQITSRASSVPQETEQKYYSDVYMGLNWLIFVLFVWQTFFCLYFFSFLFNLKRVKYSFWFCLD